MRPASRTQHALIVALAAFAPALAAASHAAPGRDRPLIGAESDAWLQEQIDRLGSDELALREEAEGAIPAGRRVPLATLEAAVAGERDGPLDPEQTARLERVAFEMFKAAPHGAMGVGFAESPAGRGVSIQHAVAGFDAERILRSGDVVLEMDGVAVESSENARACILSHDPGDVVVLRMLRRGEPVIARLRLGDYADLNNRAGLTQDILAEAWDVRKRRRAGNAPEAGIVQTRIGPDRWLRMVAGERGREAPFHRGGRVEAQEPPVSIEAGGEDRAIVGTGTPDFTGVEAAEGPRLVPNPAGSAAQIRNQLRQIEQRLRDPAIPAITRQQLMARAAGLRRLERELRVRVQP